MQRGNDFGSIDLGQGYGHVHSPISQPPPRPLPPPGTEGLPHDFVQSLYREWHGLVRKAEALHGRDAALRCRATQRVGKRELEQLESELLDITGSLNTLGERLHAQRTLIQRVGLPDPDAESKVARLFAPPVSLPPRPQRKVQGWQWMMVVGVIGLLALGFASQWRTPPATTNTTASLAQEDFSAKWTATAGGGYRTSTPSYSNLSAASSGGTASRGMSDTRAAFGTWYTRHGYTIDALLVDVKAVASAGQAQSSVAMLVACQNLRADSRVALSVPPIPDSVSNAHWQSALRHAENAGNYCVAGIQNNAPATLQRGVSEMEAMANDLERMNAALDRLR